MVWWPFATKPERADTLEVIDLYSGAPLLYSTISSWCISVTPTPLPEPAAAPARVPARATVKAALSRKRKPE
jgi:hypothetical protein